MNQDTTIDTGILKNWMGFLWDKRVYCGTNGLRVNYSIMMVFLCHDVPATNGIIQRLCMQISLYKIGPAQVK